MTCQKCQKSIIWSLQKGRYYGRCAKSSKACSSLKYLREDKAEGSYLRAIQKTNLPL